MPRVACSEWVRVRATGGGGGAELEVPEGWQYTWDLLLPGRASHICSSYPKAYGLQPVIPEGGALGVLWGAPGGHWWKCWHSSPPQASSWRPLPGLGVSVTQHSPESHEPSPGPSSEVHMSCKPFSGSHTRPPPPHGGCIVRLVERGTLLELLSQGFPAVLQQLLQWIQLQAVQLHNGGMGQACVPGEQKASGAVLGPPPIAPPRLPCCPSPSRAGPASSASPAPARSSWPPAPASCGSAALWWHRTGHDSLWPPGRSCRLSARRERRTRLDLSQSPVRAFGSPSPLRPWAGAAGNPPTTSISISRCSRLAFSFSSFSRPWYNTWWGQEQQGIKSRLAVH